MSHRPAALRARLTALILVLALALAGCGGGGGGGSTAAVAPPADTGGGSDDDTAAPGTSIGLASGRTGAAGGFIDETAGFPIVGTVFVEGVEAGARVEVVRRGGGARDAAGYRVKVTLRDGAVLYADAVFSYSDHLAILDPSEPVPPLPARPRWIWVTPVSHLAALYRDAHPESGPADAIRKVKQYLGLSPAHSVNRPYASVFRSRFSPRAFRLAARAAGGWDAFCASLIADIHDGKQRGFLESDPLALRKGQTRSVVTRADGTEAGKLLARTIGKTIGKICTSVGVNQTLTNCTLYTGSKKATKEGLEDVLSDLDSLLGEMTTLQQSVQAIGTLALAVTLNEPAAAIQVFTQQEALTVQQAINAASAGVYVTDEPALVPSFLSSLIGALNALGAQTYTRQILDACLGSGGEGNVVAGFTQALALQYGSSAAQYGFYEMRSDSVTPSLQNMRDYYLGLLAEAMNMLAESMKAEGMNTTNPTSPADLFNELNGFVNGSGLKQTPGGTASSNGYQALATRLSQQVPDVYLGGDSPLPSGVVWGLNSSGQTPLGSGPNNGILYAAPGLEFKESGNTSGQYVHWVNLYSVGDYAGWLIPSRTDIQNLCEQAKQAAAADGVTDDTAIPYGLHKMGLISADNYSSSMTNVQIYHSTDDSNPLSDNGNWGLQLYSTGDGTSGGNGVYYTDSSDLNNAQFRPQGDDNLALVLYTRPFPGQPISLSNVFAPGPVLDGSTAASVLNKGGTTFVPCDLALALFPPQEIVIGVDPTDAHHLQAWAVWEVDITLPNLTAYNGVLQYATIQKPAYGLYTEVTDQVEWLSSDTDTVEVTNFPYDPTAPDDNSKGHAGRLLVHANNKAVTITATWQTQPTTTAATNQSGSTAKYLSDTISFDAGKLTPQTTFSKHFISPDNFPIILSGAGGSAQLYLTGARDDGLYVDETKSCTWAVFAADGTTPISSAVADFDSAVHGLLKFKAGAVTTNTKMVVKATVGSTSTTTRIMVIAP